MGLDSVELVMEAEEEFKIVFGSREVEDVRTVGEFVDLIFSKLRRTGASVSRRNMRSM